MTNYQRTSTPLDTTATEKTFNTSESPRNRRAKRWASTLLSPKNQILHVPSWYTNYMTAIKDTAQSIPPPDPSSNINQQPAPSRYNLRRRQNTQPVPPTRQVSQPAKNNKNNNKKKKTKSKSGRGNKNKNKNKTEQKNDNDNDDDNNNAPNTENPDNTGAVLMEPPRKRTRTLAGSVPGSQSTVGVISGPSTIRPGQPQQVDDGFTTTTRDRQTERFSGIQKLMNLASQSPSFAYEGSIPDDCPTSVVELCNRLQAAAFLRPDKIIPESLRDQILEDYPKENLPDSVWTSSSANSDFRRLEFARKRYDLVKELYNTMIKCNGIGDGVEEVTWYGAIQRALGCFRSPRQPAAATEGNEKNPNLGNLTATLCTTSEVRGECLPHHPRTGIPTHSARVDLLIGYSWTEQPLKNFRAGRAEWPFPFTPLKKIELAFLGAIPIEVKNATGDSMDARYQLALCSSAMLRLRQQWASSQKKEYDADKPPIVVSLSVIGHVWSYYVMYLGKPRKIAGMRTHAQTLATQDYNNLNSVPRIFVGPFVAGHTTGLLPTFYLFQFFDVLRSWLVEEWAPEVFGELAGIPVPVDVASSTTTSVPTHA